MRKDIYSVFKYATVLIRVVLFGLLYYFFSLSLKDNYNFYDYAFHPGLFGAEYLVMMILIVVAVPVLILICLCSKDYIDYPDEGKAPEIAFTTFCVILILFWFRHGFYGTPGALAIAVTNYVLIGISLFMLITQEFIDLDFVYQNSTYEELVDEVCDNIFETRFYENNFNSIMKKVNFIKKLGSESEEYFKEVHLYKLPEKFRKFVKDNNCQELFECKRNSMELSYKEYYKFIKRQYREQYEFLDLLSEYKQLKKDEKEFDRKYYPGIVALFKKKDFILSTAKLEKLLIDSGKMGHSKNKVIKEIQQAGLQKTSDIKNRFTELICEINETIPESKIVEHDFVELISQISVDEQLLKDLDIACKYVDNGIELPWKLDNTIEYCNNLIIHLNLNDENRIGSFLFDSPLVSFEEARNFDNLVKVLKEKSIEFKHIIAREEFADSIVKILLKGRSIDETATEALNQYNISEYKEDCIKYRHYLELANNSPLFMGRTYIENNDYVNLKKLLSIPDNTNKLINERDREGNNILHYLSNKPSKEVIGCFTNQIHFINLLAFKPNNHLKIPFDNIGIYDMFSQKIEDKKYTYESIFGDKSEAFIVAQCKTAMAKIRKDPLVGKDWTDYFDRAIREDFLPKCHSEIFKQLSDYQVPNTFKVLQFLDSVSDVFFFQCIKNDVARFLKEKLVTFDVNEYKEAEKISASLLRLTYSARVSNSFDEKEFSSDKPAAVQITSILNGCKWLLNVLKSGAIFNFVNNNKNEYIKTAKDVYKQNQNKDLYKAISYFDPNFRESNSILDEACVLLGLPVGTEPEEVGKAWKKQKFLALKKRDKKEEEKLNDLQQKLTSLQKSNPDLKIF